MDPENPEAGVECPFYDPEEDDPILDAMWEKIREEKEAPRHPLPIGTPAWYPDLNTSPEQSRADRATPCSASTPHR